MQIPLSAGIRQNRSKRYMTVVWCILLAFLLSTGGCILGNVEEGITKPEIPEEFRGCSVYSKDSCRNCFARFYCSGGCMANSYKFHHTINDTYEVSCEMERRRVECAIMIKAALADQERTADYEEE